VTLTETNWTTDTFQIQDWADGEGAWDVVWPNSSTDWDIVLFDGATWKIIKDSGKSLNDLSSSWGNITGDIEDQTDLADALDWKQDTLTAWTGINISSNTISTAYNFWKSTTAAATTQKEVSIPWIKELNEWQVVHILPSTTSTIANSTLKVNNFTAYPMRYNNAAISTSTDSIVRPANIVTTFVFDGTYWQFMGNWLDSNTTYAAMSSSEATTWTATNARVISASVLKWAIKTHAPVSSVNGQTWAVSLSIPTKTSDLNNDSWFLTSSTWVTSVNWSHWAVTVTPFSPSNAWTTDQVLTKTAGGYAWADASKWIENDTTGTTTTVTKIRAWTEAEYALITPDANTIYYVF
jgi:hypothetical protein